MVGLPERAISTIASYCNNPYVHPVRTSTTYQNNPISHGSVKGGSARHGKDREPYGQDGTPLTIIGIRQLLKAGLDGIEPIQNGVRVIQSLEILYELRAHLHIKRATRL